MTSSVPSSRISYVFAGDINGDTVSANDLVYIPRNASDMNFDPFTIDTTTFTAEEQAAAFEQFIEQDPYLRKHRGEYAARYAAVMPMLRRVDLSIVQDVFRNLAGQRHAFQLRADFVNFGDLLSNKGGWRPTAAANTNNQVRFSPTQA